jgi:hypothetical protein
MNDEPKKPLWKKSWRSKRALFLFWILVVFPALFVGIYSLGLLMEPMGTPAHSAGYALSYSAILSLISYLLICAIVWCCSSRRGLFVAACFVTLVALFYAEENWRGQRALDRSRQELIAKGVNLDWDKFIPPPVPDDQNVFKAPNMEEFVGRGTPGLTKVFETQTNFPIWGVSRKIESETEARAYLAWGDQFQPQFTMIRDALKRPYSRMGGDYANIMTLPIPNFIAIRTVARILAQRTHCYLLVHEPDKAIAELALMHDLSHFLDCKPTGKPMTLVGAMINVAVVGLYAELIGDGLQMHGWQEPQLVELQKQLSEIHLILPVVSAFQTEPAASSRALQTVPINELVKAFGPRLNLFRIAPRGWVLQNIANETPFFLVHTEGLDATNESVSPRACKEAQERLENFLSHRSVFNQFAAQLIPNILKAVQTTAKNQNLANEALIACALERYHLANGSYPELLDALAPKFIDKIPHDIINAGSFKYNRTASGFTLYSVGWNETDEGGKAVMTDNNAPDFTQGDLIWAYQGK